MSGMNLHPKVKASAVVSVVVSLAGLAGITLGEDVVQALGVIVASVLPVAAAYAKKAA